MAELERALVTVMARGARIMLVPLLQRDLGPLSPQRQFEDARAEVDAMLLAEIARRRREGGEGTDVLSMLLQARGEDGEPPSDGELRDHLITLLLAGHETTATTLAWTFERLVRHPAAMERARAEALEGGHAYLDAVVQESQRLRPVITYVMRTLQAPMTVARPRGPGGRDARHLDHADAPARRSLRAPARVPPGAVRRRQARDLHVDPVRRRRAALPRRGVRSVRAAPGARRRARPSRAHGARPAPRAQPPSRHHVRPGARRRGSVAQPL